MIYMRNTIDVFAKDVQETEEGATETNDDGDDNKNQHDSHNHHHHSWNNDNIDPEHALLRMFIPHILTDSYVWLFN